MLRCLGAVLAAGLLAVCAGSAAAANLEGVLSPGELIKGHAKAETQCENCHTPFQKTDQDLLCERCHKEVGRDIEQKSGFHGRIKDRAACRSCHTDHKGRATKIVLLDENQFDHGQTQYPLKDAHRSVKCAACHAPGAKWRDAAKTCVACHKADDNKNGHKGALGDRCEDCHTVKKWKDTFFDHDKTRFLLRDAHADPKVACKDCHANDRFKNTPRDCYACHKKTDEGKGGHHGRYGQKCESCHVEKDWRTIKFDHDRDTKYPLRYLHRDPKVRCDDCHSRDLYRDKLSTDCIACHKKDDKHKGSEGDKCEKCHSERGWKQTHDFDHDRTKFPLKGKHGDPRVKCADCHKTQIYTEAPHACYACHKKDDDGSRGHHERYGQKCESCHVEKDWKTIKFDHDRDTRYPLLGKHQSTKCYDCHTGDLYKDKTPNSCIGCHRKDDKHKGKEGDRCEQCHVEQNWKTTKSKFDHDLTGLPLLGQHVKVDCAKCHKSLAFKDAKSACVSCHEKDDRHRRRLGSRCEDCHNAVSWRRWEFDHARRARFLLDGAHAKTDCYACHRHPIEGRALLPIGCASCHENDDAHSASFGRQCERCHVTSQWKNVKPRLGARPLSPLSQMFVPPKPNGATRSYAASTS